MWSLPWLEMHAVPSMHILPTSCIGREEDHDTVPL